MVLFWPAKMALPRSRPDLGRVDVEGRHELDVTDVVAAEGDVHQTRHGVGRVGIAVVLDALDQRAGAVADAGDGDPDLLAHAVLSSWDSGGAEPRDAGADGPGRWPARAGASELVGASGRVQPAAAGQPARTR